MHYKIPFMLAFYVLSLTTSGEGSSCLTGFPSLDKVTSNSCPFSCTTEGETGSGSNSQLRLFPTMNLSCNGMLQGVTVAGVFGTRTNDDRLYPTLQIWRPIPALNSTAYNQTQNGVYEFPRSRSYSPGSTSVLQYTLNSPISVEVGDIIGLALPPNSQNEASFRVYFSTIGASTSHYILTNTTATTYTLQSSQESRTNQPLIYLDIEEAMQSNEQENISAALVPSLLLILLVIVNIVTLTVVYIKKKRKLRKRIRENFTIKMSDLTDEFADDVVFSMIVDESVVGSNTAYMSFEAMQQLSEQEQRSNAAEPLNTSGPHEAYDHLSTSILQTGKIVFSSNDAYNTESQPELPEPVNNAASEKSKQEIQKSRKRNKFKLKITSKKISKRGGKFLFRNKGNTEERKRRSEKETNHLGDRGLRTLEGTTNTMSSIPFSPNDAYNCEDEPLTQSEYRQLSHDQPDYAYINDEQPNDTYTESQGPHYTYIDNEPIEAANTLDQEGQPLSSNEAYYASIEQASAPEYTYITGELPHSEPYYTSVRESSTSVDYYTCSDEDATAAQSGAYYSTVTRTSESK